MPLISVCIIETVECYAMPDVVCLNMSMSTDDVYAQGGSIQDRVGLKDVRLRGVIAVWNNSP